MTYSNLFFYSNFIVLPFWLLMIVAPRWQRTNTIIASPLVAVLPALLYLGLIVPQLAAVLLAVAQYGGADGGDARTKPGIGHP